MARKLSALLLPIVVAGSLVDPLSAHELKQAWSRELQPSVGSYFYKAACASPAGDLLVVASAVAGRDQPITLTLFRFDATGTSIQKEPPLPDQRGHFYPEGSCASAGDGFLLLGSRGDRFLDAVWFGPDLMPIASRILVEKNPPHIFAVTTVEGGRFAAVGHDDWTPQVIVFDRENVKHFVPAWAPDQAVAAFDLVSVGDAVTFCGLEGGRGDDPIDAKFTDPHVVVASFGLDGKERARAQFPAGMCRLFPDGKGGMVLLRSKPAEPVPVSTFARLDRDLRESDPRPGPGLAMSALTLWVEAVQVGPSFVVLRPPWLDAALDLVEPDANSRVALDQSTGAVIRSSGNRLYVVSERYPKDAAGSGLRVEAFDLLGTAP